MPQTQEIMSQKEKDYVSFCFNKNIKTHKTEINYEMIFNGQKIEYELFENKKEFKSIFGKQGKRSRKWLRPSSNTPTTFLEQKQMICELFEIMCIMKFLRMEEDSLIEIENSALMYFEDHFKDIVKHSKTFQFLENFFELCSEDGKKRIMRVFFQRCNEITEDKLLFRFLDGCIEMIPADESFISNNIWSCNGGYLLGLFLILKGKAFVKPVLKSFIESPIQDCENLQKFISVFYSLCNKTDKSLVKSKLVKSKVKSIESLTEGMSINP